MPVQVPEQVSSAQNPNGSQNLNTLLFQVCEQVAKQVPKEVCRQEERQECYNIPRQVPREECTQVKKMLKIKITF